MSTGLIPLFSKGIERQIVMAGRLWNPQWKDIFHMGSTDKRYVDHQNWQMYPRPSFRVPGQRVEFQQFQPSYSKRYIIRGFAIGDSVPEEDWKDDLYGVYNRVIPSKGGALMKSFDTLNEYETAGYFINLAYASGTQVFGMFDGVSLFNTAHPVSLSYNNITVANRPTTDVDLSIASAQAAATNLRTQIRPNNLDIIHNEVRAVVIHPSLIYIAKQIYKGNWERATADRNTNYLTDDNVTIIPWPYFTSSGATGTNNSWFVVGHEHELHYILRAGPSSHTDYDVNTLSMIYVADMRFDYGATDWRGTYGSLGS